MRKETCGLQDQIEYLKTEHAASLKSVYDECIPSLNSEMEKSEAYMMQMKEDKVALEEKLAESGILVEKLKDMPCY